jgi:hypothetical protein
MVFTAVSYSESAATFDATAHSQEIMEWRDWRIEQLKKPSAYQGRSW